MADVSWKLGVSSNLGTTKTPFAEGTFYVTKDTKDLYVDYVYNSSQVRALIGESRSAYYGTCTTAAGTAAKVVTCSNFALATGARIFVLFTAANTAANPMLNVNSTGAIAIYRDGTNRLPAATWSAGSVVCFVYNGTSWVASDANLATTSDYGRTKLNSSTSSTSTSEAATPSAVKAAYDLANAAVPQTRKINGHALSSDFSLTKSDVGLNLVDNTEDSAKHVATAAALERVVFLTTDLGSELASAWDGSDDLDISVKGILPVAHGGTGNANGVAPIATILETARTIVTNLASTTAASFNGNANVAPGVQGILPIANGGTGASTAAKALTSLGAAAKGHGHEGSEVSYDNSRVVLNVKTLQEAIERLEKEIIEIRREIVFADGFTMLGYDENTWLVDDEDAPLII